MTQISKMNQKSLIISEFCQKIIPEGALGLPSDQNEPQEVPRHGQREAKGPQSGPKEVQREPKMAPRGAQGSPNEGLGVISGANWAEK